MTTFVFIILVSKFLFCFVVFVRNAEILRGGRYIVDVVEGKYGFIGICRS